MLAFARLHYKKIAWLLLMMLIMLVPSWHWDPAVHPLAAAEPVPMRDGHVDLGAGEILGRMVAVYAKAKSYRDTGVVRKTWSGWDGFTTQLPFETAFVRGGGFRFEYVDQEERSLMRMIRGRSDGRLVLWGDNATAKTWWTVELGAVEDSTLSLAIAGATAVSDGSARLVPRMLLPEVVTGPCISDLEGATLVGLEEVGGHACYRLAGTRVGHAADLWIDRASLLIRRLRDLSEQDGKTVEKITAYDPHLNVDIPDEVFRFEPPK